MSFGNKIPENVKDFFNGSGGTNLLASPSFLLKNIGKPRIDLANYDIIHGGKDKNKNVVYTTFRILSKESEDNTIQGLLQIVFKNGYAISHGGAECGKPLLMRPNDILKFVTRGTTSVKRNAVIALNSELIVRLEDIEDFCDLPVLSKKILVDSQTFAAISKRDAYKYSRGGDSWAHVKKGALLKDLEKSLHKILLPYYRKYRLNDDPDFFFKFFTDDVLNTCNALHDNFSVKRGFEEIVSETTSNHNKRSCPSLTNECNPRKKWGLPAVKSCDKPPPDIVQNAMKHVSKKEEKALIF